MKNLLVLGVLMVFTVSGLAQGFVNFQTRIALGKGVKIYKLGDFGLELLKGDAYTAGLFIEEGNDNWVLIPGATSFFRTTDADAGLLVGKPLVRVEGVKGGDAINLRIRVWPTAKGSWEAAIRDCDSLVGESRVIANYITGGGDNGIIQQSLPFTGLESFGVYPSFIPCPEPSVVALGGLGLGALLWRNRRSRPV